MKINTTDDQIIRLVAVGADGHYESMGQWVSLQSAENAAHVLYSEGNWPGCSNLIAVGKELVFEFDEDEGWSVMTDSHRAAQLIGMHRPTYDG